MSRRSRLTGCAHAIRGAGTRGLGATRWAVRFDVVAWLLALLWLGSSGCSDDGATISHMPPTVVPLAVSMASGPARYTGDDLTVSARELLARSDEAMRALTYLRVSTGHVWEGGICAGITELASPGRLRPVAQGCSRLGDDGVWTYSDETDPEGPLSASAETFDRIYGPDQFVWSHGNDTTAQDVRVIGTTTVDGRPAWVIWYRRVVYGVEGPVRVWYTEWLDRDTLWLLRQASTTDDPLGQPVGAVSSFSSFNSP